MRKLDGFAAARCERDPLGAGNQALDSFGNRNLQLMLCSVAERKLRLAVHGFDQFRMLVSENHRSPGKLVIDIFISIHVAEAGTAAVLEIERDRGFGPEGAADSAGQRLPCPREQLFRSLPVLNHAVHFNTQPVERRPFLRNHPEGPAPANGIILQYG